MLQHSFWDHFKSIFPWILWEQDRALQGLYFLEKPDFKKSHSYALKELSKFEAQQAKIHFSMCLLYSNVNLFEKESVPII